MRYALFLLAMIAFASPAFAGKHGSSKDHAGQFGVTDIATNQNRLDNMQQVVDHEIANGQQPSQRQLDAIANQQRYLDALHDHCGC